MKRAALLFLLITVVIPLKAQFVEPFDTKIINNTDFLPYDNLNKKQSRAVLIVKKGVHVKVLNRSDLNSGRYRVRLDDGSIGWVPAEAFCEKGTVSVNSNLFAVGGGMCRNIYVDSCGETDLLLTEWITPNDYAQINQAIEMNLLPEAFRYLPPYTLLYNPVFKRIGFQLLQGYVHSELCTIFGEPEGRIDKGFTTGIDYLSAEDYFRNIINDEHYDSLGHFYKLGCFIMYDGKGIARNISSETMAIIPYDRKVYYYFYDAKLKKKLSGSEYYILIPSDVRVHNHTVYSNKYTPPSQKYSIPVVSDQLRAENASYYQDLADKEKTTQRAIEREKPSSFKSIAIRYLVFFFVLMFLRNYMRDNWRVHHIDPKIRLAILMAMALVLCPWPAHLLDGGRVGFWGYLGLFLAVLTAFVQIYNFWYAVRVAQTCRCPNCEKWCIPKITNEVMSSILVDDMPSYTNRSQRILIGKTASFVRNHKISDKDSETIISSSDIYKIETSVTLKYVRTADKRCDLCGHTWHVENEKVALPVRGPIVTKAFVREDHKWYDVTLVDDVEQSRRENGYTKRYKAAGVFDYDNWEPYLQRYVKGDTGALDEYYEKFFRDE